MGAIRVTMPPIAVLKLAAPDIAPLLPTILIFCCERSSQTMSQRMSYQELFYSRFLDLWHLLKLRTLPSVTLNCQVTKIVMNSVMSQRPQVKIIKNCKNCNIGEIGDKYQVRVHCRESGCIGLYPDINCTAILSSLTHP